MARILRGEVVDSESSYVLATEEDGDLATLTPDRDTSQDDIQRILNLIHRAVDGVDLDEVSPDIMALAVEGENLTPDQLTALGSLARDLARAVENHLEVSLRVRGAAFSPRDRADLETIFCRVFEPWARRPGRIPGTD